MRDQERTMNHQSSNHTFAGISNGHVSQTNSVSHSHASQSSMSSHSSTAVNTNSNNSNTNSSLAGLNANGHFVGNSSHLNGNSDNNQSVAQVSSGETVKCVLIGDAGIGKTSLMVSYTTNGYPSEYVATVFDTYHVTVSVDNEPVRLELVDTAGSGQRPDVTEFRRLAYPQTDVLIICFSVVSPESFSSISQRWLPEIAEQESLSRVPRILVGTQADMREDAKVLLALTQSGRKPVSGNEANQLAGQIGALAYIESSALTQHNMKDIFDLAVFSTLRRRRVGDQASTSTANMNDADPRQSGSTSASGPASRAGTLERRKASTTMTSNSSASKIGKLFSKRKGNNSLDVGNSDPAGSLERIDNVDDDTPRNGKSWKKLFCVGSS